jgi:hypothetical protein
MITKRLWTPFKKEGVNIRGVVVPAPLVAVYRFAGIFISNNAGAGSGCFLFFCSSQCPLGPFPAK